MRDTIPRGGAYKQPKWPPDHVSARCRLRVPPTTHTTTIAASCRSSIETEAADLLSKGDVHELSNFLVKHQAKKYRKAERKLLGSGSIGGGAGSLTVGGGEGEGAGAGEGDGV